MKTLPARFALILMLSVLAQIEPALAGEQPPLSHVSVERRVSVLTPRIQKGDRLALREGLALLQRTDGSLAEELYAAIGKTIKPYANQFLEELSGQAKPMRIDSLVGSLGAEYVDKFDHQLTELRARKLALLKVFDPELQRTKSTCIDALDEQIRMLMKLVPRPR